MTGIPIRIIGDARGNGIVEAEMYNPTVEGRDGESSLVVYTIPREQPIPKILPFLNDTYGAAMNQDAAFGGTPVNIHNGVDSALWSGSEIIGGKVTFDSNFTGTGWPPAGTKSVKVDNAAVGDVWQFAKGSDQDLTNYSAFSMDIYIDKDWKAGDSISLYGWNVSGAAMVGNKIFLEDYIDENNFDEAMSVAIPLVDMGLTDETISAFRMQQESKEGKAPKFYMDTLAIQETGGGIEFRVTHDPATRYCVNEFVITITDVLSGTLANGAGIIPIDPYAILGIPTLSNGINIRSVIGGETDFSGNFESISDFEAIGFRLENPQSNGTNTSIQLIQSFPDPLIINGAPSQNFLSITIADNLSGLTRFTAILRGSEVKKI